MDRDQTRKSQHGKNWTESPSMKGRAIDQPNVLPRLRASGRGKTLQWRTGQMPGHNVDRNRPLRSVTNVRPNRLGTPNPNHRYPPLMEGRTNVRPNPTPCSQSRCSSKLLQWRAGQMSSQTIPVDERSERARCLQWRAGQLSGQTGQNNTSLYRTIQPSMEGRTNVRPNVPGGA